MSLSVANSLVGPLGIRLNESFMAASFVLYSATFGSRSIRLARLHAFSMNAVISSLNALTFGSSGIPTFFGARAAVAVLVMSTFFAVSGVDAVVVVPTVSQ